MEKNETLESLSPQVIVDLYKKSVWEDKTQPAHRKIDRQKIEIFLIKAIEYYQKNQNQTETKSTQEINYQDKVGP